MFWQLLALLQMHFYYHDIFFMTVLFFLSSNKTRDQKYVPKLSSNGQLSPLGNHRCQQDFYSHVWGQNLSPNQYESSYSSSSVFLWISESRGNCAEARVQTEGLAKYLCVHTDICMCKHAAFSLLIANWFLQGITSTHDWLKKVLKDK